jgi:hypothetical protein
MTVLELFYVESSNLELAFVEILLAAQEPMGFEFSGKSSAIGN